MHVAFRREEGRLFGTTEAASAIKQRQIERYDGLYQLKLPDAVPP